MKMKLNRILVIIMALNVLISTHGFALYEHLCKFTFQKSFSLSPDQCEKEVPRPPKEHPDGPCFDKGSCCEVSVSFHKIDQATDHFFKLETGAVNFLTLLPQFSFSAFPSFVSESEVFGYADSSPPSRNVSLYILFDVFRI